MGRPTSAEIEEALAFEADALIAALVEDWKVATDAQRREELHAQVTGIGKLKDSIDGKASSE